MTDLLPRTAHCPAPTAVLSVCSALDESGGADG